MFDRLIKPPQRSFFLLGPRGSGKSTWLKKEFGEAAFFVDLLDLKTQTRLIKKPESLAYDLQSLAEKKTPKWVVPKWIVIDEIQKIPLLLDTVQSFIDKKQFCFALSGSSSRKLKRGGANLLGGRAFERFLFPLIYSELKDRFDLEQILNFGSLPEIFQFQTKEEKSEYLDSYTHLYLK
ncbi:MAG: AAA family ATPase, partial [Deltaproteobacteria bacterium]|nr:AAA family ATPase [Deltaproteobacteria bacterium]